MKLRAALMMMILCALVVGGCNKKPVSEHSQESKASVKNGTSLLGTCPQGFAYAPHGEFMMGSPASEKGRNDNETKHKVVIAKGFCMGKYEVTQGEWVEIMGSNPSYFNNCGSICPVEQVTLNGVKEFIEKYNKKHGGGYRLPTEAEWEYAARAGTDSAFYTGDITDTGCNDPSMDRAGWYCGNSGVSYSGCYDASSRGGPRCMGTHPVGQKEANAWGLYDMHGNVWELVADRYSNYPSGTVTDPSGPLPSFSQINRGGSWLASAGNSRTALRSLYVEPRKGFNSLGFRLARTLL